MELPTRLAELQKRSIEHREFLLTEEAAKTALVMPFIQALGYDVFNPSEVVPEFTADVGTKKGEKVDYAICNNNKIAILIECKPASCELNINHASQLFRYFSVTDARLAILTNGVVYQFYSDIENPNRMDDKPFFTFVLDHLRNADCRILEKFTKNSFDIDQIVHEAGQLKLQHQVRKALEREFAEPSEEFVRLIASRVHDGRFTATVMDQYRQLLTATISTLIRDLVNERLSAALSVSKSVEEGPVPALTAEDDIVTTEEEIAGYRIIQAIGSKMIDPKRIIMRDAKSYCAVLIDDNNRKTLARLHFNGVTTKYIGTFSDKTEQKHLISDITDIYRYTDQLEGRINELCADG